MLSVQGGPKIGTPFLYALTLPNINRSSKLFQCQNQEKICNNTITKDPDTPQMCRYTVLSEMSSVLKATIDKKTTSVTTRFKKLTTGNNMFIVSIIVQSNCHILQFLHQMFNVSVLMLDDALKLARQWNADISQSSVATHLRCGGTFSDSIITNFLLILTLK